MLSCRSDRQAAEADSVHLPYRGLMLDLQWAEKILNGSKTWEIRSENTKIRETIGFLVGNCSQSRFFFPRAVYPEIIYLLYHFSILQYAKKNNENFCARQLRNSGQWKDAWNGRFDRVQTGQERGLTVSL